MRQILKDQTGDFQGHFRLRGKDHTRIEGLSDGVFAIAIALLLISSEIPETFEDLKSFMYDFVPFAATISLLMMLWHTHYIFFIRYGLKDPKTVFLNTILLFLILFYVYPLKFLFKTLYELFSGLILQDYDRVEQLFSVTIKMEDTSSLMIIYGIGAMAIFLSFAMLFRLAYQRKEQLALTPIEIFLTKSSLYSNLISAAIPLGSVIIAYSGFGGNHNFTISGMFYWVFPIVMPLYYSLYHGRKIKALEAELDAQSEITATE